MDEKYKALYELSLKILEEEQNRMNRLDEKASRYFSVLSFLIGIYGIFCSKIISDCIPAKGWLDGSLLGLGCLALIGLVVAWLLCFAIFRQHMIKKIPLNDKMVSFFNNNNLADIHYALSKANKDALAENRKVSDKKSSLLAFTYKVLSAVIFFVILMGIVSGVMIWSSKNNIKKGETMMTDGNKPDKPKEDLRPPEYDQITEGYVPAKDKKVINEKKKENK
jgi:hypothetical protein